MKFGLHVSIAGGIDKAPLRAYKLGCECFQIFSRSPRGGDPPPIERDIVDNFLNQCSIYGINNWYIHAPYFVNLASEDENIGNSSINIISEELQRAKILNARYIIMHLGSSKRPNKYVGINKTAERLKQIFDQSKSHSGLLLENSAGQGASIGATFEELATIIDYIKNPEVGICLDTAHLFAAGYDIRSKHKLDSVINQFSKIVGMEKLKLLHGNDSKINLGEKKDRHEHIGEGKIGINGFRAIVNHPLLSKLNLIAETPIDKADDDILNLKKLRSLSV